MPRGMWKRAEGRVALCARWAAGVALLGMGLLFVMILVSALPALWPLSAPQGGGGVFSGTWQPYEGHFGILPMICGSLLLAVSALALAWPLALALCCHTLTSPRSPLVKPVRCCVRFMAAVPTVVYGFAAIFLVTPFIRAGLAGIGGGGSGFCWLTAALMLALLALPAMVLVLEAALAPRLERLCPGGLALGFTRLELLYFFVFPASRRALLAAGLLGFGRALGDTLLPLMLAGNAPQLPSGLTDSLRSLTAHMALVTANEVGGAAYNSLFAAGALLLLVSAGTSLGFRRLRGVAEEAGPASARPASAGPASAGTGRDKGNA